MYTRRNFIKHSSLLGAAITLAPGAMLQKKQQVGIQLYSLREEVARDIRQVIPKIAAAGFDDIETYGYNGKTFFGLSPQEFKALLTQNGLKSSSGHYGLDNFLFGNGTADDVKKLIDTVKAMGQQYLIVPSLGFSKEKTPDDYKKAALGFNKAGELCNRSGITIGFHNHAEEFRKLDEKTTGYEILVKETHPGLVVFEMDLYWVVRAGQDPLAWFKKYPGRFPLWHVKDMDKTTREKNTEVGSGSIDFTKIFAKSKQAGLKSIFLEQENFDMDAYESIKKSNGFIREKLLK